MDENDNDDELYGCPLIDRWPLTSKNQVRMALARLHNVKSKFCGDEEENKKLGNTLIRQAKKHGILKSETEEIIRKKFKLDE